MRLAVLAGIVDGRLINVEPLSMPEPTAQRRAVKDQLMKIKGLSDSERRTLLQTYDRLKEQTP